MGLEGGNQCGSTRKLGCRKGKKGHVMNGVVMRHCLVILKKLMTHPAGWIFNQPVDPVKLNIPDYFTIISEPMDLGTIKSKLENKLYMDTEEFAADVRLTFSNAMRYNPPRNEVHIFAKELNNTFNLRWKSLEATWRSESSTPSEQPILKKTQKQAHNSRQSGQKLPVLCSNSSLIRSMTFEEKQNLRKDLAVLLDGNTPPTLLKILRKFGLLGQNRDRFEVDFNALDEKTLRELEKIIRNHPGSRSVKSAGKDNQSDYGSCQDLPRDLDSGKVSSRKDQTSHGSANKLDCLACNNTTTGMQGGNSDHDSDDEKGFVGASVEEIDPRLGPATTGSIDLHYHEQLSPSKALRAATLRTRFANTILKAQHKTLLNNGEKGDAVKMQQEREQWEKEQQEVKARIEAQMRAAEAAERERAETKLKLQRETERAAARIALQKMEKTVDIDENKEIFKDLEMLGYSQLNHQQSMMAMDTDGFYEKPLERLGLFMKNDDMEDDA